MISMSTHLSKMLVGRQLRVFPILQQRQQQFCVSGADQEETRIRDTKRLLDSVKKKKLRSEIACENIVKLVSLNAPNPTELQKLKQDKSFEDLVKSLATDTHNLPPRKILECLKSLSQAGIPDESQTIKNLENSLRWGMRTCRIDDLSNIFYFAVSGQTESKRRILNDVCLALERRWVEITDPAKMVLLIAHADKLSSALNEKLEDRIQDVVEHYSPKDLVNILSAFAKSSRRSLPVLQSLGFYISKNRNSYDIKQLTSVLIAFKQLSLKNQDVLDPITSSLETLIESNKKMNIVRSILNSLGSLKFLAPGVLENILSWFGKRMSNGELIESRDLTTFLLCLANLNFKPLSGDDVFEELVGRLNQKVVSAGPHGDQRWLDVVWALLVLDSATNEHLESVLDPLFCKPFLENKGAEVSQSVIKLLNINTAAKQRKDYTGPKIEISRHPELVDLSSPPSKAKLQFLKTAEATLTTLYPLPRFMAQEVRTGAGFVLDAEIIVDEKGKPFQVEDYTTKFGMKKPVKELPANASRVAIFITPLKETLVGGGWTGAVSLRVRLAIAQGYTPLVISPKTIDLSMNTAARVQKIDVLVKHAIGQKL